MSGWCWSSFGHVFLPRSCAQGPRRRETLRRFKNFLGCTAPATTSITLPDFEPGNEYYITWFPTRMNSEPTDLPEGTTDDDMNTSVLLDFVSQPLGGVLNGYLDTLHSDYAFLITPEPFFKSLRLPQVEGSTVETDWDFSLYPNPTRDALFLKFQDDLPKDVVIMDVSGRRVAQYPTVTTTLLQLPTDLFAKGVYWVHVASGENRKVKKLIVH